MYKILISTFALFLFVACKKEVEELPPNESEFEILVSGITGPGTYQLNNTVGLPASVSYGYYVKRNFSPENEWLTSATYTGSVTLTRLDTVAKVVSGTFQFNALNIYNTPQPLSVTEGRFDLRLQ